MSLNPLRIGLEAEPGQRRLLDLAMRVGRLERSPEVLKGHGSQPGQVSTGSDTFVSLSGGPFASLRVPDRGDGFGLVKCLCQFEADYTGGSIPVFIAVNHASIGDVQIAQVQVAGSWAQYASGPAKVVRLPAGVQTPEMRYRVSFLGQTVLFRNRHLMLEVQ